MRDAFGGEFTMKLLLVFLFIYVAFAAVSYNYAKAFRVKNTLIDFIEENQVTDIGAFFSNNENVLTLKNKLIKSGYNVECSNNTSSGNLVESMGKATSFEFCGITINEKETSESNKQIHYEIVTQAYWNLGALNKLLVLAGKSENSESAVNGSFKIKGEAVVVANKNTITSLTPTLIEVSRENNIKNNKIIVNYKAKFSNDGISLNINNIKITDINGNNVNSSIAKASKITITASDALFSVEYDNTKNGTYIVTFGENCIKLDKGGKTVYSNAASIDTEIIDFKINKIERLSSQYQCNSSNSPTNNDILINLSGVYSLTFNSNTGLKTSDVKILTCSSTSSCVDLKGNADVKIIKYEENGQNAFNIVVSYEKRFVQPSSYGISNDFSTELNKAENSSNRNNTNWLIKKIVDNGSVNNEYNLSVNDLKDIYDGKTINEAYILSKNIVSKSNYYLTPEQARKAQQPSKNANNAAIENFVKEQTLAYNNAINNAIKKIKNTKDSMREKITNIKKYNNEVDKQKIPNGFKIVVGDQSFYQDNSSFGSCPNYNNLYQFKN